jgi:hypothetical protein
MCIKYAYINNVTHLQLVPRSRKYGLQIADVTEQRANEKTSCCNKTPEDKDTVLTSGEVE